MYGRGRDGSKRIPVTPEAAEQSSYPVAVLGPSSWRRQRRHQTPRPENLPQVLAVYKEHAGIRLQLDTNHPSAERHKQVGAQPWGVQLTYHSQRAIPHIPITECKNVLHSLAGVRTHWVISQFQKRCTPTERVGPPAETNRPTLIEGRPHTSAPPPTSLE